MTTNHETYHPNYLSTLWEKSQCDANRAITYSNCDFVDQNTGEKLLIEAPDLDTGGLDKVEGFTKVLTNYTYANALWSCYSSKNVKWAPPFLFNRGGDHAFAAGLALTGEICFVKRKLSIRQRDQKQTLLNLARGESATNDNPL